MDINYLETRVFDLMNDAKAQHLPRSNARIVCAVYQTLRRKLKREFAALRKEQKQQ